MTEELPFMLLGIDSVGKVVVDARLSDEDAARTYRYYNDFRFEAVVLLRSIGPGHSPYQIYAAVELGGKPEKSLDRWAWWLGEEVRASIARRLVRQHEQGGG